MTKQQKILNFATELGEKLKGKHINEKDATIAFTNYFNCNVNEIANKIEQPETITAESAKRVYKWSILWFTKAKNKDHIRRWIKKVIELRGDINWSDYEYYVNDKLDDIYEATSVASIAYKKLLNKGIHYKVINKSQKHFQDKDYFNAIDEAAKLFDIEVQNKAKIFDRSLHGVSLMEQVFGVKGCICLTTKRILTEKNQEEGLKCLAKSIVFLQKNPTSHELNNIQYSEERCLDYLCLISIAMKLLEECQYYQASKLWL